MPDPAKLLSAKQKAKTQRNKTHTSEFIKSFQHTAKTVKTHQSHDKNSTKILIDDRQNIVKPSIYDMTTLSQHLNNENKTRYRTNQT